MLENAGKSHVEKTTKAEATIASLTRLLETIPAAEELSQNWTRSSSQTLKNEGPRLKDLMQFFDSGKAVGRGTQRGIPMWIVVRMCKATWHQDGTWPLLGADEKVPPNLASTAVVRSLHPAALLLRPLGANCFQLPPDDAEKVSVRQPELSADDIAEAYRRRGIQVEEAESCVDW